ncbi:MAG: prepilin-type N-terminal cleavage/methylation domain-containing protein [Gammaproteobacteria bacterium]|nr:prepilin-type N-terminal cleavage/methylation domain-containing protein [Gammaproteobacteria bacterium]
MRKRQYGFTLIELLVVLGILSLLLATVPPLLTNAIDNAKLRNAQREIISGLRLSRNKAVTSQQAVTFTINAPDRTMTVSGKNRRLRLPDDVGLSLGPDDEAVVRFYPDGSSSGGQLSFRRDDRVSYIIDVDRLTGRVTGIEE